MDCLLAGSLAKRPNPEAISYRVDETACQFVDSCSKGLVATNEVSQAVYESYYDVWSLPCESLCSVHSSTRTSLQKSPKHSFCSPRCGRCQTLPLSQQHRADTTSQDTSAMDIGNALWLAQKQCSLTKLLAPRYLASKWTCATTVGCCKHIFFVAPTTETTQPATPCCRTQHHFKMVLHHHPRQITTS